MKYLFIALASSVSLNAMHPDLERADHVALRTLSRQSGWSDINNEGIAREILSSFFGECEHKDMIENLVPYLAKRIEHLRLNRLSRYHALRSSVSAQFRKKLDAQDEGAEENIKEILHESIEECYKEKELASKEKIEKIQSSRTKFTALVSAITGISMSILTAVVTILLSNNAHQQPIYGSDSAATTFPIPTITPEVLLP